MIWQKVADARIEDHARYLVKTNGTEWRDVDTVILPGIAVKHYLEPQIVRGRPTHVALITEPTD
jgi:hypothetical protein